MRTTSSSQHASTLYLLPFLLACTLTTTTTTAQSTSSSKRGIVYVNPSAPSDDRFWTDPSTPLTWYYNYVSTPTASFASSAPHLSFVPMLWGAPPSPTSTDTTFLDSITNQLESSSDARASITHILAFNEPDGPNSTGGSNLSPEAAANAWLRNIKPLRDSYGLKAGLPAVTGSPRGTQWLADFNASCLALNPSDDETSAGCPADFLPLHWYGNFEGLASHMGQLRALYPQLPLWITEYGLPNAPLPDTQAFFNMSAEYFDRVDFVDRYSYFGSFRADVSNVGPNAALLNAQGELTDIGSWYLGGAATGNGSTAAGRDAGVGFVRALLVMVVAALWVVGC